MAETSCVSFMYNSIKLEVYPVRVLVDQIYSTKPNIAFCHKNGIRIGDPIFDRPTKDEAIRKKDARTAA